MTTHFTLNDKPALAGGTPVRPPERYVKFCPPKIEQQEIDEVVDTLKSGWLGTGPKTKQFEEDFKRYVGSPHAIGVNSCTAGLHLALLAHGIGPGDEVIVPAMTFAATANVIEHVGARPIFADCAPGQFNISAQTVAEKITSRTKGIIPVHFAGLPVEMDDLNALAREKELVVIEDAAHAVGSTYQGKKIGNSNNTVCFSFYPTKNMTTIEGGMITTPDTDKAQLLRVLSLHGMSADAWKRYQQEGVPHYQVERPGFKYNLPDVNAALGIHQLRKLDGFNRTRAGYARMLSEELRDEEAFLLPPAAPAHMGHSWHLFPLRVNPMKIRLDRDGVLGALKAENVGTGIHFEALHLHRFYRDKYGYAPGSLPRAEAISQQVFSIPFSHSMEQADVADVITALTRIAHHYKK